MRVQGAVRLVAAIALLLGGVIASAASAASAESATGLQLRTLSNRADLISGGDAVLQVVLPAPATGLKVLVGDRDVTAGFAATDPLHYEGLVDGLAIGPNVVTAQTDDGQGARLVVTNHPTQGPVFSGPQVQPWYCLPDALDAQCSRPITYAYQYMSSTTGNWAAYDPSNPPADVATTTTDQGKTVPYIVRIESGDIDRSAYSIAVLYDGSAPFDRRTGPSAWNHKVVITHGGGCAGMHTEGVTPSVLDTNSLGRGFVVMSTALEDSNQDCNLTVQAESVMMAKEHIIEAYGDIRYVIGIGSSGGSLAADQIANAYPGLYDGLIVGATFPDMMITDMLDCLQMHRYFDSPQKWGVGAAWAEPFEAAAEDKQSTAVCRLEALPFGPEDYANMYNPASAAWCNMDSHEPERVYNPTTNPTGVRCAIQDYMVNILGTRAPEYWGAVERQIGRGFANRPYDNVGLLYGLKALKAGTITRQQFVDLNVKVGATDIDFGSQATRVAAEPAGLDAAYRSGMVNEANNLDRVPIIDIPNPGDNYDIHDEYKSWAIRARLDAANGNHDNHVLWYGPDRSGMAFNVGDGNAFVLMDQWLTTMEHDQRDVPLEQKVVDAKPAGAHDRCDLPDPNTCKTLMGPYGSVRMGAGDSPASDIMKCQLKPLARTDFGAIAFTDAEWTSLQATFPDGVCDWTKPGVGQQQTVAWQTYENKAGGEPLGAAPVSEPLDAPPPDVPEVPATILLPLVAAALLVGGRRLRSAR
jgi:pimeloyl-ACP methyl ester carboxylesterase